MDRDSLIRASNESRRTPRWTAIVHYLTDNGILDVTHDLMEISDLQARVERGPDWHTIDHIEIRFNPEAKPTTTVEQALKE